jgi:uncharacterized membrane protein
VKETATGRRPVVWEAEMTMWDWGSGLHWWGWVLGIAATLIFWALVIWSIVALVSRARGRRRGSSPSGRSGTSEERARVLARQYVAGDIDGAEYDRQLAALHARPYAGAGRN